MIIPESKAVIYNVGVSPWSTKLTEGRRKKCSKKFAATLLRPRTSDLGPQTTSVAPLHYARPSWEIAIASRR